ncbi:hypothetical protein [Aliikangiella sp. G2MR2-5]|uniref:hypothetical protein n=1 Tax=Aliikangiella sp. G2MR2-5 TaxID=2788943 RepID=UPI0018AC34CC|nr:hypothetical protein [Aliikangiella sp. G2MR2-5]
MITQSMLSASSAGSQSINRLLQPKNFIRFVLLGLGLSIVAFVAFEGLNLFYIPIESLKATISLVTMFYLVSVLKTSRLKVGKVSLILFLTTSQLFLLFSISSLDVIIGSNLIAIWLARTFYIHRNTVDALADIAFIALGFVAAMWAFTESQSLLLSFWSFFLVQAFLVFLPQATAAFKVKQGAKNGISMKVPEREPLTAAGVEFSNSRTQFENAYNKAQKYLKEAQHFYKIIPGELS